MNATHHLAVDNISYLQQGRELLQRLPDELYTKTLPPMFPSGIGVHYRHSIDHYSRFLEGWRRAEVDYDKRERDEALESDRAHAIAKTDELIEALRSIGVEDGDQQLTVKMSCGEGDEPESAVSTVKRELQFLISHTVHHYALIAVILRLEGREPVAGFGVAPSTLKHQQSLQCAR